MNKREKTEKTDVSMAVIRRMPRYLRCFSELFQNGAKYVSSEDLSLKMKITASQIRQDFNNFGSFGQQGIGYDVEYMLAEIKRILGLTRKYNVIVIGAGKLGRTLILGNEIFNDLDCNFTALFDTDSDIIGKRVQGVEILHFDKLREFTGANKVDLAILTIPGADVADSFKAAKNCGIKAFWNFTGVDLDDADDCFVENVHLADSLMVLAYRLSDLS